MPCAQHTSLMTGRCAGPLTTFLDLVPNQEGPGTVCELPLGSLSTKHKTHTHHHLHSSPLSSPRTQTAKPERSVGRKLQRWRWQACSLGAGSPSARTRRSSWSLQRREGNEVRPGPGPEQHNRDPSTAGQHELPDLCACSNGHAKTKGTQL